MNAAIGYLAQHPLMGRSRPEVEAGIRSFRFEAYVIFYLALEDGIELVRGIHCALDLEDAWHGDDADELPK